MIVYDLECRDGGHRFEGWFGSSDDFAQQQVRGLVTCPQCGSAEVGKAVMAPAVGRKGNQVAQQPAQKAEAMSTAKLPPQAVEMMKTLAKMQAKALESSRWVGESFAEDARAMHYGERDHENIHGQATIEEARDLLEEGIDVAPLPFPVVSPDEAN